VAGDAYLVWNEAALRVILAGDRGPVAQDLLRRCLRVESKAKWYASGNAGGPGVATGRLRGSITHELGHEGEELVGIVGTNVEYGPFQEFGTSRMPPHPFLRPALEAAR
jgi:HK97 gp10 family phage protein